MKTHLRPAALALALSLVLSLPALALGRTIGTHETSDHYMISNVVDAQPFVRNTAPAELVPSLEKMESDGYFQKGFSFWGSTAFTAVAPVTVTLAGDAYFWMVDANGQRMTLTGLVPHSFMPSYSGAVGDKTSTTITQPGYYAFNYNELKDANVGQNSTAVYSLLHVITQEEAAAYAGSTIAEGSHSSIKLTGSGYIDPTMYTIYHEEDAGTNYVQLRSLAASLTSSKAQFNVTWDQATASILITTGQPYTPVQGASNWARSYCTAVPSTVKVLLNGAPVDLDAYTINDNTYFKLRDLGKALNFNVAWDQASQSVSLDPTAPYSDAN